MTDSSLTSNQYLSDNVGRLSKFYDAVKTKLTMAEQNELWSIVGNLGNLSVGRWATDACSNQSSGLSKYARDWLVNLRRESGGYPAEVLRHINILEIDVKRAERIADHIGEERDRLHRQLLQHAEVCGESAYPLGERSSAVETKSKWKCGADRSGIGGNMPQDCDWPYCGCDETATKVIEALQEQGWMPVPRSASMPSRVRPQESPNKSKVEYIEELASYCGLAPRYALHNLPRSRELEALLEHLANAQDDALRLHHAYCALKYPQTQPSAQETSEQPATEDRNWNNGFLACAAMFESGQVSDLRETVAKINRAGEASVRPAPGEAARVISCAKCGVIVSLPISGDRVALRGGDGWYFSTETGWLCPIDAPK